MTKSLFKESIVKRALLHIAVIFFIVSCTADPKNNQHSESTIKEVMDSVITRVYANVSPNEYPTIDDAFMLDFLTKEEKSVLATQYQYFKVNVPVTVSLMRNINQKTIPFWLKESGFQKTKDQVKNEVYTYEIWQKDFEPGWVHLGIPGFDKHRPVYFITVGPKNISDELKITETYPSEYSLETMKKGAFTYHDWSDLTITELPAELEGQVLFTTVRGRAREAHVQGAFRETVFPSSNKPDQIVLTWSKEPTNSIDIQWRTDTSVKNGDVAYWKTGTNDTVFVHATTKPMEDRMLYNDRYIHRHTAHLDGLDNGSSYEYKVGSKTDDSWSKPYNFKTEADQTTDFSFIWFGDTHKDPKWAENLQKANLRHPEISFYSIAGDIVTTGLYRNEWDEFFGYEKEVFSKKPLMPVPGNHDRQDGLGAWMYYELFSLPENGPKEVHPESTYAFEYGNALFLMIDSTHPNEAQTEWIEEQLRNSKATWKFAMFHFPPYNFEEPYLDIQEAWCGIFDTYHVDMVMSGHIHYYMRSKPINHGKVVDAFNKGTVYAVSIGTNGNHDDIGQEPYAEKRFKEGRYYQHMTIKNGILQYNAYNEAGEIVDSFEIKK
ncbi:metallophosphoesterase family protein [Maribacter polysiphoniae]|uniref:Calcineurin-like phosphoesterase family protein n=1 Tax=Maribacter polysiphoniae TaxID=429344 RepID=A0A316DZG3_9FLAO|nr:metallophosphoesterase family protein [Maribacter polysiphoniae]MBD1260972.1 metallophosphoesterase family protein [Maribacter polysiphoniae]PWK23787.1 calcineurin-like phosphoesterase family protein [Maribacter polysiphoniae]